MHKPYNIITYTYKFFKTLHNNQRATFFTELFESRLLIVLKIIRYVHRPVVDPLIKTLLLNKTYLNNLESSLEYIAHNNNKTCTRKKDVKYNDQIK